MRKNMYDLIKADLIFLGFKVDNRLRRDLIAKFSLPFSIYEFKLQLRLDKDLDKIQNP